MYTFYKIRKEQRLALVNEALAHAYDTRTNQLDCSVSYRRMPTDKTIPEILDITTKAEYSHFVFIIHRGEHFEDYIEVGVRVEEDGIDYFIFIEINKDALEHFINKYKLTEMGDMK